jgi:hypothetical protein
MSARSTASTDDQSDEVERAAREYGVDEDEKRWEGAAKEDREAEAGIGEA